MKNTLCLLTLFINSIFVFPSYSQISRGRNIHLRVATTLNHQYLKEAESGYGDAYQQLASPPGYAIELGIDSVRIDWMRIDLALNFEQYNAKFKASTSGLPGGTITEVDITKSVLGLTLYPIRIIKNNFRCQIGLEYSRLLNEQVSGYESTYLMGQKPIHIELNDLNKRYSSLINIGIRIKAGYTFRINNHFYIAPYYALFYSLSREYSEAPVRIKSIRNSFGLTCLMTFK
jgi:hypothetical protein